MDYDLTSFTENCFLEQKVNDIIFRCINTDPQIAMALANIWSEVSYSELTIAYDHAKIYQSLKQQKTNLKNVLNYLPWISLRFMSVN